MEGEEYKKEIGKTTPVVMRVRTMLL